MLKTYDNIQKERWADGRTAGVTIEATATAPATPGRSKLQ